jgi:hypothetical protein
MGAKDEKQRITYHELNISLAMDFPVYVEGSASVGSDCQLAPFSWRKLEDSVWIGRMGQNLSHGRVGRPGSHVRRGNAWHPNGCMWHLHLELKSWGRGDAVSRWRCRIQTIYTLRSQATFTGGRISSTRNLGKLVLAYHMHMTSQRPPLLLISTPLTQIIYSIVPSDRCSLHIVHLSSANLITATRESSSAPLNLAGGVQGIADPQLFGRKPAESFYPLYLGIYALYSSMFYVNLKYLDLL